MNSERKTSGRGMLLVITGAAIISISPIWVKIAQVGPTTSAFYRTFLGGAVLAAIVLIRRNSAWPNARQFGLSTLCGLLFALDLALWHYGVKNAEPGLATILANFQVFLMAAWGVLVFKERLNWRLVVSIPLALIGLAFLVGIRWQGLGTYYRFGVVAALSAAVAYTAYLLILRKTQTGGTPLAPILNMAIVSLTCAAFSALGVLAAGESFSVPNMKTWGALIMYGVFSQVVGWMLISLGLPRVEASRAGLALLAQPALAFTWDVLFFKHGASGSEIIGAVVALTAIYMGLTGRSPVKSK
jgi:drug/metabolite transporter (DMT)-like permease